MVEILMSVSAEIKFGGNILKLTNACDANKFTGQWAQIMLEKSSSVGNALKKERV